MATCFRCGHPVIWGGDFSFEDYGAEGSGIVSNYSCPERDAYFEAYYPEGEEEPEEQ